MNGKKQIRGTNSELPYEIGHLKGFEGYRSHFKVYRHDRSSQGENYLLGLLKCERGKANMERIQEEQEEIEYRSYQHFISNSPWDHQSVIRDVSRDVSLLMEEHKGKGGKPTGLIIDESSHLKKGKCSVGVARQYAGIVGKVDNCQVGVYGSLVNESWARFAYFQAQRYWVERNFDDAKNELGLSDYQVRKWLGWHHHHAILFMAMLFMLKERISNHQKFPLMSIRDARIMVTTLIAQTMIQTEPEINRQIRLMKIRHEKRKKDIDRYFMPDS